MGGVEVAVIDMSDDDAWFVVGTSDVEVARDAVRFHIRDLMDGARDHREGFEALLAIATQGATVGDDWWWQPVDPEEPSGEAYLRNAREHATPTSAPLFTGVHFS